MALCVVGLSAQGLVQGQPHPSAPNVLAKTKSQSIKREYKRKIK